MLCFALTAGIIFFKIISTKNSLSSDSKTDLPSQEQSFLQLGVTYTWDGQNSDSLLRHRLHLLWDFFYSFHTHLLSASLCRQTSLCDVKGEDNLETDKLYHFLTV